VSLWSVPAYLALTVLLLEVALVLRRGVDRYRGYFALLVGNLALVVWVVNGDRFSRESGAPTVELVGATVACLLLVFAPGLLDRWARRAIADERFDQAARLMAVKELLVPGRASAAEREFYAHIARARSGGVDEVLGELRQRLADAEPPEDDLIQERIVTMLVFARRWREAATQFETHIGEPIGRYPGLAVQMVRVYGELDDLERAAEIVERLEGASSGLEPGMEAVVLQARLQLLAYAGAVAAVERLLGLEALQQMSPRMHEFFRRVARARADLPGGDAEVRPLRPDAITEELARFLEGVAERASAEARTLAAATQQPLPTVTFALIGVNIVGYALFAILLGDTDSIDHLVRGGASFHPAVRAGEWWRLWTAMFLHSTTHAFGDARWMHIVFNLCGLYLLGRIVEPVFGAARFLAIYCIAGLVGNLASVFNPNMQATFSIGASGAVLGIMGALMVALLARRGGWPERWRQNLIWNLAVLLLIELIIGWVMPVTDNFAHGGGLVGGGLAALALLPAGSPARRRSWARTALTAITLVVLAASAGRSIASLVRERPADTLARLPRARMVVGPITVAAPVVGSERVHEDPADWPGQETLRDHAGELQLSPHVVAAPRGIEEALRSCMARDAQALGSKVTLEDATAPRVDGWVGTAQARPPWPEMPNGVLYLYYGRPAGNGAALVVEMNYLGDRFRTHVMSTEIRLLLRSIELPAN
jgi:membrane associated rhomboid family serine protease